MKTRYSYQNWKPETMARAFGRDLPISTKQGAMICNFIRGKPVAKAKQMLQRVLEFKTAVPFTKHNRDMGHKPGIGPGRYPQKAVDNIMMIVESAESNASAKGLDSGSLTILHAACHKASKPWRYGRQMRRKAKRSHIEIAVGSVEKKETEEKKAKK